MKSGFYSVRQVDGDEGTDLGVAILAHVKDGRLVGVDQGGCKLSGFYEDRPDGTTLVRLSYALKAGSPLPGGDVLDRDMTIPSEFLMDANADRGAVQLIDLGWPVLVRLEWLAEPA